MVGSGDTGKDDIDFCELLINIIACQFTCSLVYTLYFSFPKESYGNSYSYRRCCLKERVKMGRRCALLRVSTCLLVLRRSGVIFSQLASKTHYQFLEVLKV